MRAQLITFLSTLSIAIFGFTYSTDTPNLDNSTLRGKPFNTITLELSLKPFKKADKAYIGQVATELFTQWSSLLRHTDTVSVMLWTSDGSEILDYTGKLNQPLEWAKYMGNPNTEHEVGSGPADLSLHQRALLYMDNPPAFTYGDLKYIIQSLKDAGQRITGKPIRIGATFDPGPEFAHSDFKYKKHPEILGGNAMGHKTMVSCYSTLNADNQAYAGFPKGIPANTPFGTFLGRQSQHFLTDLGYDYIWLSNGFGFGVEGWSSTGAIFDGKAFASEKLANTRELIAGFWNLFRKECPAFQIQTRGTNLSTGADLARDGVDLKQIYSGHYNMLPPPNSPWAALDGDFGLEMVGYMSRMAELPDERYLFRYYTHDPWWVNSPWLDRYGQEPHDIYLPMAVARINAKGEIKLPTHLNFLTADNTYGEMPAQVPDEVTPHILKARYDSPTAPGPLVWVYPFEEYHTWAYKDGKRLPEIYYGDWLIRQAINNGFPLNTILSTNSFQKVVASKPTDFNESVLVSIVPEANSSLEKSLIDFVQNGGKLLVYGPADHAGAAFMNLLNLQNTSALEGDFQVSSSINFDKLDKPYPDKITHRALFSGGGVATQVKNKADAGTKVLAKMTQGSNSRDVVWVREKPEWKGGKVAYVRGTNSSKFTGGKLLTPDDPEQLFTGPLLMRYALNEFGLDYRVDKKNPSVKSPVLAISRSSNGFFFSGYCPNTTVTHRFKMPQGAPLLTGYETDLTNGYSVYNLPKAWHKESRFFVEQPDGIVSCQEMTSGVQHMKRCVRLTGLKNATVRIYPDEGVTDQGLHVYANTGYPWGKKPQAAFKPGDKKYGNHYVVEHATGDLVVFW
ncbi:MULTISPECIES: hypothetical protein [unclassified Spirosoma]|uniref:hypothetical protein n=1 Tax=unclassified Spirosoma TaxID=2621999 RepID=UPI00095D5B90|nr:MULTISPECIES: hypothetical protein [unclassified Spirosoma]MBN8825777.1 hypothetical protein [Spirosoma sp.]OJW74372.1 MAG: hypothetical protein BGO59_19265 [Spirosoma sp. 48-14]